MALLRKLKRALRGEVTLTTAAREALRRSRAATLSRRERATLDQDQPLSLAAPFAGLSATDLLNHFKQKKKIGFSVIAKNSCPSGVSLAEIEWRRDRSGYLWPLEYHRDLKLIRSDGSDVRVVWELNRLGHLLRVRDAKQFIAHLRSWHEQNPYARGPNWSCAMEVALRAVNLLAAFEQLRTELTPGDLHFFLQLMQKHDIAIPDKCWHKLHQMLEYIKAYLRPDGLAPLIGDTDGGQVLPFHRRAADDHSYLLEIGAEVFNDPELKRPEQTSKAFPDAGIYIMRHDACYLCFNATGAGIHGRGSHGHNDALSIEISARGRAFIIDPGTYVYSADLQMRHAFRSTAYHSTVKIDGHEQNTTDVDTPFVIGNEARPRVLEWQSNAEYDKVVAEHYGYRRLPVSVTHRRTVTFNKAECSWLVDDEFFGSGEHDFEAFFHFNDGLQVEVAGEEIQVTDKKLDVGLVVRSLILDQEPALVNQHVSRDYGELRESVSACWRVSGRVTKLSWKIYLT